MNRPILKTTGSLSLRDGLRFFYLFMSAVFGVAASHAAYAVEYPMKPSADIIREGERLTLERCVEIALQNQPNMIAAKSNALSAGSKVGQAEAAYYPQVDLSTGYSKISTAPSPSVRSGTEASDDYSMNASLKQNIYDFGKTRLSVKVQEHNLEASRSDLENTAIQTVFNVKEAYYGVLLAARERDVASDTVKQFEQHLTQAKGFYEAGTKPKFDVTKAEVDLSNARLNMIKAKNALKIAKVTLNSAMGVLAGPEYEIEDNLAFTPYNIAFDEALSKAFGNRPDLKSTVAKRRSAQESVELSKKGYYPSLSGNAEYSRGGEKFPLQEGWNVGATLTIPIFSGFLTKYQVEEAKANLNASSANEDGIKQTVFFDVQQAYLFLGQAQESVPVAEIAVKQAEENLQIANGRYSAGVGSPIEVTDAQVSYITAKTAYIKALSDYKVAQATLEKVMGGR